MATEEEILDEVALLNEAKKPAPSEIFTFWRKQQDGSLKGFRVRIRLLSDQESIDALAEAQREARERKELPKEYGDIYREMQAVCVVRRCLCYIKPETRDDGTQWYRPLHVDNAGLMAAFNETELSAFLNMHEIVRSKYSFLQNFDDEHVDEWAARLSDHERSLDFLASLDSSAWPELLTSLARRVASLSESLGQPLPSWRDTSAFDHESSESGTGGSTESPPDASIETESGTTIEIPSGHLLTRQEASEMVERINTGSKPDK